MTGGRGGTRQEIHLPPTAGTVSRPRQRCLRSGPSVACLLPLRLCTASRAAASRGISVVRDSLR